MPIWVAVTIVAAAFGVRTVLRGASFDRMDALLVVLFVALVVITVLVRRWVAAGNEDDQHTEDDTDELRRETPDVDEQRKDDSHPDGPDES
jgi:membrane protein implicated in regulation of membrane protease activity